MLVNEDGERLAAGSLEVTVMGAETTLSQRFVSETTADSIDVVVDSDSLKPISSVRTIENENPDDEDLIEVTYTEAGATVKVGDRQTGLSVPEHSYDNDTSLFLWRTLPFAEGYEASYTTIITNRRSRQEVVLTVRRKETVTVPPAPSIAGVWRSRRRTRGRSPGTRTPRRARWSATTTTAT